MNMDEVNRGSCTLKGGVYRSARKVQTGNHTQGTNDEAKVLYEVIHGRCRFQIYLCWTRAIADFTIM